MRFRAFFALAAAFAAALAAPSVLFAQTAEEIDNSLLWRQALGGSIIATPSAQVQSVTLVLDGGLVRTYSDAGRQLWEYAAGGRLLPFLARSTTGMTFFGRTNGVFYALNRAGKQIWEKRLPEPLAWSPLIGWDGRIFVFLSKKIICFTATGSQLWDYPLEAPVSTQPVANTQGGFLAALKNNTLLLVTAFGEVTKIELAAPPSAVLPANYPDVLAFYSDGDLETIKDGVSPKKVIQMRQEEERAARGGGAARGGAARGGSARGAAAAADSGGAAGGSGGTAGGSAAGAGAAVTPPKRIGGKTVTAVRYKRYVAALLDTGNIVLWSLEEERALWTKPAMLGINRARLLFDERGIYLFSMSGAAGWTMEGSLLWNMKIQGATVPPVLSDDGILYYGGSNWLLFAYKVEHRSRSMAAASQAASSAGGAAGGAAASSAASSAGGANSANIFNLPDEGNYGLGTAAQIRSVFFDTGDIDITLKQIARGIKNGAVGTGEPYAYRVLLAVAGGGDATVQPDLLQRLEALRLVGIIGSREAVPFLAQRLSAEQDPNIRAGIIEALGRIGVDPHHTVLPLFDRITALAIETRNTRLLTALAEALGRLCRFSGPPISDSGAKILVTISAAGLPSSAVATKELEALLK